MNFKYLIIILISMTTYSQVSVEGVVKDEKTLTSLEDVRIQLRPISKKGAGYWTGTMTKKNGIFKVSTSMKLPANISFEKEGCGKKTIKLKEGDEVPSEVFLDCSDEAIKAIIIEQTLDTDGDGLVDKEDKCPKESGLAENEGCPAEGDSLEDKAEALAIAAEEASKAAKDAEDAEVKAEGDEKAQFALMTSISSKIYFALDVYLISDSGKIKLKEIKALLDSNPSAKLLIEGHASSDGDEDFNTALSNKRAEMVKSVLIEMGVDSLRLSTKSYGEDKPAVDNSTSEGRSNNRRVEISMQ